MKSCCKKLKIPVSPQEQVIPLLNSIHIQSIAAGIFFGSPPNLLQQQNSLYYFCTQESVWKSFLTFKPPFRDVGWPNSFPTAWQVWNAPRAETNKHSELLCLWHTSIHPPSQQQQHPLVWAEEETWPHPHSSHWLLLNSKESLSCMGKWLSVRGKNIEPDSLIQWLLNQMRSFPLLQGSRCETVQISPVITNVILSRKFIVHLLVTYRLL